MEIFLVTLFFVALFILIVGSAYYILGAQRSQRRVIEEAPVPAPISTEILSSTTRNYYGQPPLPAPQLPVRNLKTYQSAPKAPPVEAFRPAPPERPRLQQPPRGPSPVIRATPTHHVDPALDLLNPLNPLSPISVWNQPTHHEPIPTHDYSGGHSGGAGAGRSYDEPCHSSSHSSSHSSYDSHSSSSSCDSSSSSSCDSGGGGGGCD